MSRVKGTRPVTTEPGHVYVPHDVGGIEPEVRRFDRLRSRVDVLLGERKGWD